MSVIRKCVCCGKEYDYCPNCAKKEQPSWMFAYCSEGCKELFNIVSAYNSKRIGKPAVQAYVKGHAITPDKYVDSVKRVLNEVSEVPTYEQRKEVRVEERPVEKKENAPRVSTPVNNNENRNWSRNRRRKNRNFGY